MTKDGFYFVEDSLKMPLMALPLRCSIIKLATGGTVIISPTANIEQHANQIKSMGDVKAIVAPSLFHHLYVLKAHSLFPDAKLYGVAGLDKKRPDIPFHQVLTPSTWPYHDDLELLPIAGMAKINEATFYHKKSRSLIVVDLAFNIKNAHGFGPFLILSIFGTRNKFGVSRLFKSMISDREAFLQSIKQILSKDFDRIVMAHGQILESGGKEALINALREKGIDPK